jgi:hypothetical protein
MLRTNKVIWWSFVGAFFAGNSLTSLATSLTSSLVSTGRDSLASSAFSYSAGAPSVFSSVFFYPPVKIFYFKTAGMSMLVFSIMF